jgi:hypothetical protein
LSRTFLGGCPDLGTGRTGLSTVSGMYRFFHPSRR